MKTENLCNHDNIISDNNAENVNNVVQDNFIDNQINLFASIIIELLLNETIDTNAFK